jgi:hypothetical protein
VVQVRDRSGNERHFPRPVTDDFLSRVKAWTLEAPSLSSMAEDEAGDEEAADDYGRGQGRRVRVCFARGIPLRRAVSWLGPRGLLCDFRIDIMTL